MVNEEERRRVERMIGFRTFGEFAKHLPAEIYVIYHPTLFLYEDFQSWSLEENKIIAHNQEIQKRKNSKISKFKSIVGIEELLNPKVSLTHFDRKNIKTGTFKVGVTGSKPKLNKAEKEYMDSWKRAARNIGLRPVKKSINRSKSHRSHGWTKLRALKFDTGKEAYEVEQAVLDWLRSVKNLEPHLQRCHLPQGGWTETVDASKIELATIWRKVIEFSRLKK